MKKQRKKPPFEKRLAVFLIAFGALTLMISMIIALTAEESLTLGQMNGVLISGFGIMEAGAVTGVAYRRRAGKDISFSIGACIGIFLVALFLILFFN